MVIAAMAFPVLSHGQTYARLTPRELEERAHLLREKMRRCSLCPHQCGARRLEGRYGVCRSTTAMVISSAGPHLGEEAPLSGTGGSGTIFFASCNLKCLYCQNYEISQLRIGRPVSADRLADRMIALQDLGCHNINLVTPTHVIPQIVESVSLAVGRGLRIPLVYNCGGYESPETLRLLEDIIDIYMPDIKYSDERNARVYSGAPGYWEAVRIAVKEMYRQVGNLQMDGRGIARRGLLIRHLVLPNGVAGSRKVLDFVAHEISADSYVNIMDQYHPSYRAYDAKLLNRRPSASELAEVVDYARNVGLTQPADR